MLSNRERVRHLPWSACYNARDLGGYATADGHTTRWGAIVRSDNLARLSVEGRAALLEYGVSTVVDLRCHWELSLDPSPFPLDGELEYRNLPLIDDTDAAIAEVFEGADSKEAVYTLMLDRSGDAIRAIVEAIATARAGGIVVHCHSGKDRTGLVAALLLAIANVPEDVIVADYALTNVCLRPLHDQQLDEHASSLEERAAMEYELSSPPEVMTAVLRHLEQRYGGPEGYLLNAGVTPETILLLRRRMLAQM